ncbi:MAG: nitrogenase component 1 [Eubacteriales bacterium]|nr:nitrogenase component 1 [Eubacteriales bacterium]
MKGLWKYISPFAPDQSGATAVLCEMGGLIVIIDAGGCAGNICGFDEPRWFEKKSAIFSAGLRDMDAILGRDDRLVKKVQMVCEKIDGEFVALVGTPVPAVIGTDYKALQRMIEVKTGIPALPLDTNGVRFYDSGSEKAWLSLFQTFAGQSIGMEPGTMGIIGATPFDVGLEGFDFDSQKVWCYGMGAGIEEVKKASTVMKNLVVAPSGLKAARYLAKRFGTPYEVGFPLEQIKGYDSFIENVKKDLSGEDAPKKILIVHQQVLAHSLRQELRRHTNAPIVAANWFMMDKELREPWDVPLSEEDQWVELVMEGGYDLIIGDPLLQKAIPDYKGRYYSLPHFAVSGKYLAFEE